MCGIFGLLGPPAPAQSLSSLAERACRRMAHRGPDDHGVHAEPDAGLVLGHLRLAVVDVSPAGHQPMRSADGRFVIVFNGEIYNHLELRKRLRERHQDAAWRGHSDTETLLACIAAWGVEQALQSCVGMFAFGLWDKHERQLLLARDRVGEKPLYYGWAGESLAFASELKGLADLPGFHPRIDRCAVAQYMRFGVVPGSRSIFEGIHKLAPGHTLRIDASQLRSRELHVSQPYWSLLDAAQRGLARQRSDSSLSDSAVVDTLDATLRRAVAGQMLSDVPLGAFLSGGVDSATVAALMQAQSPQPVKTFSIGFHEEKYDEARFAKAVARHLGTDHTELHVGADDARAVIPRLPHIYCEPFADPSQIPTLLVCQMAREHVTVALSGDAGDELFGGYTRYFTGAQNWRRISRLPMSLRRAAAGAINALAPETWEAIYKGMSPLLPSRFRVNLSGDKLHKLAGALDAPSGRAFYERLRSVWPDASVVPGETDQSILPAWTPGNRCSLAEYMMAMDAVTYLPDDILVKVDRAAMSVSLETRVPMLDHRVVEFAWDLPLRFKIRDGQGKWALRQVLHRYVPAALLDRPKMGFAVPIDQWLRGPLRDWAESLLQVGRLQDGGLLAAGPIRTKWIEHLDGTRNWQYPLWNVLMFQAWREQWSPAA